MTRTEISSASLPGTAKVPAFDRQQVFDGTLRAIARLERMAKTQRRTLEHAKTTDDYLGCLLKSKHAQQPIKNMLDQWFTPETIADAILEELNGIKVSRRKLINVIQRYQPLGENDPPRKRRGRPPRSAVAAKNTVNIVMSEATPVQPLSQPFQTPMPRPIKTLETPPAEHAKPRKTKVFRMKAEHKAEHVPT